MHKKTFFAASLALGVLTVAVALSAVRTSILPAQLVDCSLLPPGTTGCAFSSASFLSSTVPSSQAFAACGNGKLEAGEECDDGHFNGRTTCSLVCEILFCGDGAVTPAIGEQCEPETSEEIQTDPGTGLPIITRTFSVPTCGMSCTTPVCGPNGKCVGGCKRVFHSSCGSAVSSPHPAAPSPAVAASSSMRAVSSSLSSGKVSVPSSAALEPRVSEATVVVPACGNAILERGEQCDDGVRNADVSPNACRVNCMLPSCGDGVKDRGEECDDGNAIHDDGCSNLCRLPRCNDGILQNSEACDDGNRIDEDGCSNDCRLPSCGDGIVQRGEQCDDGNKIPDDSCTDACRLPRCGDGVLQGGEQCDDGSRNSDTLADVCRRDCTRPACGDGVVDQGEACDDGNRINDDVCANDCRLPRCGDGILQAGEQCDPSAPLGTGSSECTSDCKLPRCGDDIVQRGEQCDDGNSVDGDACSNDCRLPRCGDGIMQAGESCDPSAPLGTGSEECTAACKLPRCGDGIVQRTEQCDEGERNSDTRPDACRNRCTIAFCGDGVKDRGEECDSSASLPSAALRAGGAGGIGNCSQDCHVLTATTAVIERLPLSRNAVLLLLSGFGAAATFALVIRLVPRFRARRPSLDDIPLNEIEMPGER